MNTFNLGVYELKDIESRFRNLFCRAILDTTLKRPLLDSYAFQKSSTRSIAFFSICSILVYYLIATFISFTVRIISMYDSACFIKYHFNIIPFTYNSNIVGCFINSKKNKLFSECFKTTYNVNLFQNRIGFRCFNSSLPLNFFCQSLLKCKTSQVLNIPPRLPRSFLYFSFQFMVVGSL